MITRLSAITTAHFYRYSTIYLDIHIPYDLTTQPFPQLPAVKLNANRQVSGVLRGFDQFMNIVLDNTVDEKGNVDLGMVVVRGNSIITIEALERIDQD